MVVRKAAAAGRFYPRFKSNLKSSLEESFKDQKYGPGKDFHTKGQDIKERSVLGGVFPHAGYPYSGPAAAHSIQKVFEEGIPDTVIILVTSHTGYNKIGLMKNGDWETPLGKIKVDSNLASLILEKTDNIHEDDSAFNGFPHGREHCIEVQVPFVQYAAEKASKTIKILPIKVGVMDLNILKEIGKTIAAAIEKSKNEGKDIAVIASSDMTHYQPDDPYNAGKEVKNTQYKRDEAVIDAFLSLDIDKTYKKARETSVCGPQTISTLLAIGNELGYKNAEKIIYYTSFEKTGEEEPSDYSVGYFSGVLKK